MTLLLISSTTMNQRAGEQERRPAGIDGDRKREREERRDDRTDIGDEAQQPAEHAPKDRVRNADQPEPDADRDGVGRVHDQLHQEISADAARGVVERLRGARQIARAGETDQAVAQILALQQHEDHEDDDDAGGGERADERSDDGA